MVKESALYEEACSAAFAHTKKLSCRDAAPLGLANRNLTEVEIRSTIELVSRQRIRGR
jgi:hypothetical protein